MAARCLPNVEVFFEGFLRLLETSENNLHSATYDNSEFLFRRLDAHERTLSTLLNRIEQTYHGVPQLHVLTRDLCTLLSHTSNLRSHYESRFFLCLERDSDEHLPTIVSNSLNRRDQGAGPGRLRVRVTREQLQSLNEDAGFTWSEISRTLGISERTLRRRRHEFGMRLEGKEFSSLSDSEFSHQLQILGNFEDQKYNIYNKYNITCVISNGDKKPENLYENERHTLNQFSFFGGGLVVG